MMMIMHEPRLIRETRVAFNRAQSQSATVQYSTVQYIDAEGWSKKKAARRPSMRVCMGCAFFFGPTLCVPCSRLQL